MNVAAITLAASLFAQAFGGSWQCAVHGPKNAATTTLAQTPWHIFPAPGGKWTIVTWGADGRGGIAYVGYDPQQQRWVYDDYHYDGSFYRDFAASPDASGTWRWYGTRDQSHIDRSDGPISWRRANAHTFVQRYRATRHGKLTDFGDAVCTLY